MELVSPSGNSLFKTDEPGDKGCKCLLTLQLHTSDSPVTIVSAYAPTLTSTPEAKDEFYSTLSIVIKNIPSNKHVVLLGDFNAGVGAEHDSWPSCLGHFEVGKINFGVGKINENRQHLLELCSYHGICMTNSFQMKPQHTVFWTHSCSKHRYQLDMVIVRGTSLEFVLLTRT